MKKTTLFLLLLTAVLFTSCSGSDTYRGDWKATNEEGEQVDIVFGKKDLKIVKSDKTENYEYTQNSISIENSVETYGIRLGNGKEFQIHFPIADDESKGAILDANGRPLYIISRDDYIGYKDIYGL